MILVTGGTGFVGRRLVDALAARSVAVRVLTRSRARTTGFPERVEVVEGDVLDAASLSTPLRGVTTIVHLAASVPGSTGAKDTAGTNVDGTRNLARAARANSVNVFVHGSSAGVYGDGDLEAPRTEGAPTLARSDYERSKLDAEGVLVRELADSAVHWVIVRPTGIHGPGRSATLAFYRDVQRKNIWMHGPARVIVHPTHVDDLVQVILLVLARKDLTAEIFNVGGERPLLYEQLIEIVAQGLNRRVVQLKLPAGAGRVAGGIERAARMLGVRPPHQLSRLAQPIVNRAVDISKAQRMLGFGPVPLEASIMDTIAWFNRERLL